MNLYVDHIRFNPNLIHCQPYYHDSNKRTTHIIHFNRIFQSLISNLHRPISNPTVGNHNQRIYSKTLEIVSIKALIKASASWMKPFPSAFWVKRRKETKQKMFFFLSFYELSSFLFLQVGKFPKIK